MDLLALTFASSWTISVDANGPVLGPGLVGRNAGGDTSAGSRRVDVLIAMARLLALDRLKKRWRSLRAWPART